MFGVIVESRVLAIELLQFYQKKKILCNYTIKTVEETISLHKLTKMKTYIFFLRHQEKNIDLCILF